MRLIKWLSPRFDIQGKSGVGQRQCWAALFLAALAMAGCGQTPTEGEVGRISGFFGGAATDEPNAALIARDTLSAGGNAADAAVAAYFALAVTYPNAAALGGGGVCVVYDRAADKLESLEFLPGTTASGGSVALPGAIRGMAALHARYGRLRWGRLLAPAEAAARLGRPVSRALDRVLKAMPPMALRAPSSGNLFFDATGKMRHEGQPLVQIELAAVLTRLRNAGPADFYGGHLAKTFLADLEGLDLPMTASDLRGYLPRWREPLTFEVDNNVVATVATKGGERLRDLWLGLYDGKSFLQQAVDVPLAGYAKASAEVYADLSSGAPVGGAATTGFAVTDRDGNAVACTLTMLSPFGMAVVAPSTGIMLAPAPQPRFDGAQFLSPVLVVNHHTDTFFFAASAGGGAAAPVALVRTALGALAAGQPLGQAIAAPRLFRAGPDAVVLYEPDTDAETIHAIGADTRGAEVRALGRVNAIHCADGLPEEPESCAFRSDGRGYGLASRGEQ